MTLHFNALSLWGNNLVIGGTNGLPAANYYVLASTNLASGSNNWHRIMISPFDGMGNFLFTNQVDSAAPQNFFRLQLP